jgi:hypothetical protein
MHEKSRAARRTELRGHWRRRHLALVAVDRTTSESPSKTLSKVSANA